jgi:hypothetical protein
MDGEVMKKISLILVMFICFFGLGSVVYASPVNEKVTEFLDYCLSMVNSEEEPCEITKVEKEKPVQSNEDATTTTPHCMTENTDK